MKDAAAVLAPVACGGQALPLALLLAAAVGIAWMHMAGLGATAGARQRLTHTADAVAYSGALVQARSLNLLATINRAQMAHQVGMAHVATLAAWAQHGAAQAQRGSRGNPPAMVIGMLFGPTYASAYSAARSARTLGELAAPGGGLAQAQARHEAIVHEVLEHARRAIVADLPRARQAAMEQVLAANYEELGGPGSMRAARGMTLPALAVEGDDPGGFIVNHAPSPRGTLRGVVEQAVAPYAFLRSRNRTARNPWPVSRQCPWLRHELRRRGETVFDSSGRWQSHDTLSYHALRGNRRIGCYFREYPMGWGRASAHEAPRPDFDFHDDPPEDFSAEDFWRWVQSATDWGLLDGGDNRLANSYAMRGAARWPARGLPGFSAWRGGTNAASGRLRLALRLRQQADTVLVPGQAAATGRHAYQGLDHGEGITVRAAAETYFMRPHARPDGRGEAPSLFHPYWQARLVPETPR